VLDGYGLRESKGQKSGTMVSEKELGVFVDFRGGYADCHSEDFDVCLRQKDDSADGNTE